MPLFGISPGRLSVVVSQVERHEFRKGRHSGHLSVKKWLILASILTLVTGDVVDGILSDRIDWAERGNAKNCGKKKFTYDVICSHGEW